MTRYMTPAEQLGSLVFFYVFLPSMIILGIWWIVMALRWDAEYEQGYESFADDFLGPDVDITPLRNRMLELRKARA